jgi:hypothetical protein
MQVAAFASWFRFLKGLVPAWWAPWARGRRCICPCPWHWRHRWSALGCCRSPPWST